MLFAVNVTKHTYAQPVTTHNDATISSFPFSLKIDGNRTKVRSKNRWPTQVDK